MNKVVGILLAAGTSSRMGRPKQLLRVGGLSLLDRLLAETLRSDLDLVVLVLGCKALEIRKGLKADLHHPKLTVIENTHYRNGIASSVLCGLRQVEEGDHEHVMIILGDMPYITSELINLLLHQYLASGLSLGAIKTKSGKSHPVIIGRRFYPDLHQLQGDVGARDIFARFPEDICLVEPGETYQDVDIDTQEDYAQIKRSWPALPSEE